MLHDRPPRSVDEAIAVGERLSALLMAAFLNAEGTPAAAVNAAAVNVAATVSATLSYRAGPRQNRARPFSMKVLLAVTGFNGATANRVDYARAAFDFSASILAAALETVELWIWTDVDGIMTAVRAWFRMRGAAGSDLSRSCRAGYRRRQSSPPAHLPR